MSGGDILFVMAVEAEYGEHLRARIDPLFTGVGPVEAGVACDDENACTLADSCDGLGHCGGAAVECNDNGLCQEPGTCDPAPEVR